MNYNINTNWLKLPSSEDLDINKNILSSNKQIIEWKYIFSWVWNIESPEIWDIRISYEVIKPNQYISVFWEIEGVNIVSHNINKNNIFHAFYGDKNQAIKTLHSEYVFKLRIIRVLWFIMIWISLNLMTKLIKNIIPPIPFIKKFTKSIISIVTFIGAIIISSIAITISSIFHNWIAIIILILMIWRYLIYKLKNKTTK